MGAGGRRVGGSLVNARTRQYILFLRLKEEFLTPERHAVQFDNVPIPGGIS